MQDLTATIATGWDKFRSLANIKYLISGAIATLIFLSMLSAAPSPWWDEHTSLYTTRLFLNYADSHGTGVNYECLYSDSTCTIALGYDLFADGTKFWPIYSAAEAFVIISVVASFVMAVVHFGLAFIGRFIPRPVMVVIHGFNIGSAIFLCITTILPWTLLMSLHSNAARNALPPSTFPCSFYLHVGDLSDGGPSCSFAGNVLNSTTGENYWNWQPTGGWILNVVVFWITILLFLPVNVLWVINTSAPTTLASRKSTRRGRGMSSSRNLAEMQTVRKDKPSKVNEGDKDTNSGEAGGGINFGDDEEDDKGGNKGSSDESDDDKGGNKGSSDESDDDSKDDSDGEK